MLSKRGLVIAALSALCLTMILAAPTNSLVGYYDPWLDYDDNGDIDMKDVAASARAFGSFGDPTKNVNVTNWPVGEQVCVWWDEYLTTSDSLTSIEYKSYGFCRMHILVRSFDLSGDETIKLTIYGLMKNPTGLARIMTEVYSTTLTAATPLRDTTIFVPSEEFKFKAETDFKSAGDIYLNFYLTWA